MLNLGVIKILSVVSSLVIAVGIVFNPLTYKCGDIAKIKMLSQGVNEIIKALGFHHNIGMENMINIIIFLEYIIFGLSLMFVTKTLYERTLKNIFFPLFIGLFLSVSMGYYGYKNKGIISGISSVAVMFYGLLWGIGIYLLVKFILSKGKFDSLGNKSKYRKGR